MNWRDSPWQQSCGLFILKACTCFLFVTFTRSMELPSQNGQSFREGDFKTGVQHFCFRSLESLYLVCFFRGGLGLFGSNILLISNMLWPYIFCRMVFVAILGYQFWLYHVIVLLGFLASLLYNSNVFTVHYMTEKITLLLLAVRAGQFIVDLICSAMHFRDFLRHIINE